MDRWRLDPSTLLPLASLLLVALGEGLEGGGSEGLEGGGSGGLGMEGGLAGGSGGYAGNGGGTGVGGSEGSGGGGGAGSSSKSPETSSAPRPATAWYPTMTAAREAASKVALPRKACTRSTCRLGLGLGSRLGLGLDAVESLYEVHL